MRFLFDFESCIMYTHSKYLHSEFVRGISWILFSQSQLKQFATFVHNIILSLRGVETMAMYMPITICTSFPAPFSQPNTILICKNNRSGLGGGEKSKFVLFLVSYANLNGFQFSKYRRRRRFACAIIIFGILFSNDPSFVPRVNIIWLKDCLGSYCKTKLYRISRPEILTKKFNERFLRVIFG